MSTIYLITDDCFEVSGREDNIFGSRAPGRDMANARSLLAEPFGNAS